MSETQKQELAMMREANIGAILVNGFGYVWPTDIRNDGGKFGEANAQTVASRIVTILG